jgi:hypothetical protein
MALAYYTNAATQPRDNTRSYVLPRSHASAGGEQLKNATFATSVQRQSPAQPQSGNQAEQNRKRNSICCLLILISNQRLLATPPTVGQAASRTKLEAFVEFFPPQVNAFLCEPF